MAEHASEEPLDNYGQEPSEDGMDSDGRETDGGYATLPSDRDPMYDSGIVQEDILPPVPYGYEFGVTQFGEASVADSADEAVADTYHAVWAMIDNTPGVYHDEPAHYRRTDGSNASDIRTVELHHQTPFGVAKIVRDEHGISVDYTDTDGVTNCNRYTLDGASGTAYKDTANRAVLFRDIPPVGSIPRDTRMQMIADAERKYAGFTETLGIAKNPVSVEELEHIQIDIHEGRPPQVTFNDMRTIMRRRRDSREHVTDDASHRAIKPLRSIVSYWAAARARHGDPLLPETGTATDESPGAMEALAGYGRAGRTQHESATIITTVKAPLEPGEVALWLADSGAVVEIDANEAGRVESTLSLTEIDGKVLGKYQERVFDSNGDQVCGKIYLYNADEDDVRHARNLLFDPTFYKLEA